MLRKGNINNHYNICSTPVQFPHDGLDHNDIHLVGRPVLNYYKITPKEKGKWINDNLFIVYKRPWDEEGVENQIRVRLGK